MIAPGRGRPVVFVMVFGEGVLDAPNAFVSAEECDAMAKAWSRAAEAIRSREYGKVRAFDSDGDEMLEVGLDYKAIEFDDVKGLPLIAEFKTARKA